VAVRAALALVNGRNQASPVRGRKLSVHRRVPVTTMSISRLPHFEQTSLSRHSGTAVSAPYRAAISAGSGST